MREDGRQVCLGQIAFRLVLVHRVGRNVLDLVQGDVVEEVGHLWRGCERASCENLYRCGEYAVIVG